MDKKKSILVLLSGILLFYSGFLTQAKAADDEYSFQWLDPDKKIYVLQNRRYLKANRLLVSAMGGIGFSNPYRNSYAADGRVGYYLFESIGFEGFYQRGFHSENSTMEGLKARVGSLPVLPVVREVSAQYGGLFHWVPWYAKINVFNWVLYFDWYLSAGAGYVTLETDIRNSASSAPSILKENKFSFFWGTGHQYHLNEWLTVRLDFTSAVYRAALLGNTGAQTWFSNLTFNTGVGVRF